MEITLSAVTYKDWRDIIKRAVKQAKLGNAQARSFLANYIIGPAQQKVDVTTKGESLNERGVDSESHKRAVALLADAFRAELGISSTGKSAAMGTAE